MAASATQLLNRHVAITRRTVVPMYRHVVRTVCLQYADEARRLAALTRKTPPWRWASTPDVAVSA